MKSHPDELSEGRDLLLLPLKQRSSARFIVFFLLSPLILPLRFLLSKFLKKNKEESVFHPSVSFSSPGDQWGSVVY